MLSRLATAPTLGFKPSRTHYVKSQLNRVSGILVLRRLRDSREGTGEQHLRNIPVAVPKRCNVLLEQRNGEPIGRER